jgi:excisionase family DNA binding protein
MSQQDNLPLAFSVEDAATLAGVGRSTMYQLVNAGIVPCKRIGRRIIIPVRPFIAWLEDFDGETSRQGNGRNLSTPRR